MKCNLQFSWANRTPTCNDATMHFELLVTVSCGVQVQKHSTGNVLMSLAETVPSLIKSAYQHALECTPTPSNGLSTAYTVASMFQTVSRMGDGLDQLLIKPSSEVGVVT